MAPDRRTVLKAGTAGLAWAAFTPGLASSGVARPIAAIAFDGFVVFDTRPVAALAERLYPGRGAALIAAWRTRQFEYQWLRTLSGRYADFIETSRAALVFASRMLQLDLTRERQEGLMHAMTALAPWPDSVAALRRLKAGGVRLAFCSNMTARMLEDGIRDAGLGGLFDHVLSTDRVQAHKPDPRAYAMARDAFALPREEVMFAAFAGWDAAGAAWFGYPTYWVNRLGAAPEELGAPPAATGTDLEGLARHVAALNA